MQLRDALLASLAGLPGTREFHLHTLTSAPRKHTDLYPYAKPRPRAYLQDIIVLVSEQATPDAPRLFVAAIEAHLYHIPATKSAILYISKVDSTGQGGFPSPVSSLLRTLLVFYGDPITRPISIDTLWVHIFARAQNQYLFPNSSEHPLKKPLTDIKLCVWWKRVLSSAAEELEARLNDSTSLKLYYLLPGYNELEAIQSLNERPQKESSSTIKWQYRHPYSQAEIPLPAPSSQHRHLGEVIPYFDDDPKSRFLDEIACVERPNGSRSPERKRPRKGKREEDEPPNQESSSHTQDSKAGSASERQDRAVGELAQVTPDEFWERMSFRQECVTGAVSGFLTLIVHVNKPNSQSDKPQTSSNTVPGSITSIAQDSPLAPRAGQVSPQVVKRVMTLLTTGVEFSNLERSMRGTELTEGLIRSLCEGLTLPTSGRSRPPVSRDQRTPEPEPRAEFLAPPKTPPPKGRAGKEAVELISPNPFDDPELSLETYHSHIYGSVFVKNAEAVRKTEAAPQEPIKILAVRKKKK